MISSEQLPAINATRVRLRWLTDRDLPALFAVFSDPMVMRFWGYPIFADIADARQFLHTIHQGFQSKQLFQWGLTRKNDDHVIGTCTLIHLDASNRRAELGYALGREHWGNGYMHEGLTALLDFAFNELELLRIEADVDPRNTASIRSLEKLGFRREGYLRERWIVSGEVQDSLFYGLLKKEWDGAKEERALKNPSDMPA